VAPEPLAGPDRTGRSLVSQTLTARRPRRGKTQGQPDRWRSGARR
jgi:hypothetical protein